MHFYLSRYRFPRYPYVKEKDQFLIFIISIFVICSDLSLTYWAKDTIPGRTYFQEKI